MEYFYKDSPVITPGENYGLLKGEHLTFYDIHSYAAEIFQPVFFGN